MWRSRKFLTMLADVVFSLITYFVGRFVAPDYAKDILVVIAALQPVIIAVIAMWGIEDAAAIRAGVHPGYSRK